MLAEQAFLEVQAKLNKRVREGDELLEPSYRFPEGAEIGRRQAQIQQAWLESELVTRLASEMNGGTLSAFGSRVYDGANSTRDVDLLGILDDPNDIQHLSDDTCQALGITARLGRGGGFSEGNKEVLERGGIVQRYGQINIPRLVSSGGDIVAATPVELDFYITTRQALERQLARLAGQTLENLTLGDYAPQNWFNSEDNKATYNPHQYITTDGRTARFRQSVTVVGNNYSKPSPFFLPVGDQDDLSDLDASCQAGNNGAVAIGVTGDKLMMCEPLVDPNGAGQLINQLQVTVRDRINQGMSAQGITDYLYAGFLNRSSRFSASFLTKYQNRLNSLK